MKNLGVLVVIFVLLLIVVGIGFGTYSGVEFLSVKWGILSNDWKAILIVVGALLIACSLYVSWSIQSAMKRYALKGAGKVQVYNVFIDWYAALKQGEVSSANAAVFREIRNRMALWGGKQVSRQAHLLFEVLNSEETDAEAVMKKADDLYLVIRRELGNGGQKPDRDII